MAPHLLDLPTELLERIFVHVHRPRSLVETCKRFRQVSLNPAVRCFWLICRYGRKDALAASSLQGNIKLIRGEDVGLDTFKLLMKLQPGPIPRSVVQLLHKRLTQHDLPHHIIEILSYGTKLYKKLSLDTNDFEEIIVHIMGYNPEAPDEDDDADGWEEADSRYYIADSTKRAARIKELVEVYNFDLNWNDKSRVYGNTVTGVSGEEFLAGAIDEKNHDMINVLIQLGVATHNSTLVPKTSPPVESIHKLVRDCRYDCELGSYKDLMQRYISTCRPKTKDAVVAATAHEDERILKTLLKHESTRWTTEWGQCVLCCCVQIAFDKDWDEGLDLLFSYFHAIPRCEFRKSQAELHRALTRCSLERRGFVTLATFLRDSGIQFVENDITGWWFRYVLERRDMGLLQVLFDNYSFPTDLRILIAELCVKSHHRRALKLFAAKQPFNPPSKLLDQCVIRERPDMLQILVQLRIKHAPKEVDPRFERWLCSQNQKCIDILTEWQRSVRQAQQGDQTTAAPNGKGKKREADETGEAMSQPPEKKTRNAASLSRSNTKTAHASLNGGSKNSSSQRNATNGNGGQAASSSTTQPAPAAPSRRTTRNSMKSSTSNLPV